MSELITTADL